MAPRSGIRPSFLSVYSLFDRITRFRRITTALLTAVLLSNQVAAATLGTAPIAAATGQDLRSEFYSSGWAKSLGIHLTSTTQGSGNELDGRGAQRRDRPAPARAETKADRETKVARIKIYPGDVEIAAGEQVIFTAVGLDSDDNAIGGLDVRWECLHEDRGRRITVRQGSFSSPIAGRFIITAEMAGRREQVRVTVKGKSALPRVKSKSEIKTDSRQLRRISQVSRLAPSQGNAKRLIAGKNTASKNVAGQTLRASSKSMARVPRMFTQLSPGEDPTGWNSQTVATFSNVGAERGDMPGRAPSAGVGSGNFQITAPGVSLDGRGIDINLPLHYNSRVWHNSGGGMYFDIDRDTLVAGWNIGFGRIVMTGNQYMLIDADGTRHEFSGSTNLTWPFQAFQGRTTDGSFIDYSATGYEPGYWQQPAGQHILTGSAVLPNGTKIVYGASGNYAVYPTRIIDADGNYITITYRNNKGPNINTITDTLGRIIRFHYDGGNLLTAITVPGLNGGPERQVVRLAYRWLTLSDAGANYGFSGVSTMVRQNTIPVLLGIYYPATGNGYWFGDSDSYSRYGMLRKVSERRGMTFSGGLNEQGSMGPGEQTRAIVYSNPSSPGYSDIPGSLSDTPTYTQMSEDWLARQTDSIPVTSFSVEDTGAVRKTTVTRPDGIRNVQCSDTNSSSGSYGMMVENLTYPASGDTPLARSRTFFETGAYDSSRPTRIEIFDERGRMTFTTFGYGSRFNAPTDARLFGYSGQLLKRVTTEYLNNDTYNGSLTSYGGRNGRHIFDLASMVEVFAGDDSTRVSRVEFEYDGKPLSDNPGAAGATQHDISYNPRAPLIEVCGYQDDQNDPDCRGECLICGDGLPCPSNPPDCDWSCNQVYVCNSFPQYNPATWHRGNVTRVTRYANAASLDGGSAVVEHFTYDVTGNLRIQSTSCCEQTTINYTANTAYAWPESVFRGSAGDPATRNTTSAVYDFNTGLVMDSYDANGGRSNTEYNANSLRAEREYAPTGAYVHRQYFDAASLVKELVYEPGKPVDEYASKVERHLDGKGRVHQEFAFAWDNVLVTDEARVVFDNLGRVQKQSRPFRTQPDPSILWTTYEYDALDRPVRITSPDGSVTQRFYNESSYPNAATSNVGQTVRSRDAWGRERWARLDEQSRLVEVVEPNPSGDGAVASGGMSTQFQYDTPGNLTQVNQGAQTRRFRYDSLGRLTHQKLAEADGPLNDGGEWVGGGQWSDVFSYDKRSNLTQHVDARGVKTVFKYKDAAGNDDPLNRLLEAQYDKSGSPVHLSANIPDTPKVTYGYMTGGDRMRVKDVNVGNGMVIQNIEYDVEGRVSQVRQTFAGREDYSLDTDYLWDTLSRIKEVRYPKQYGAGDARKVITHNYDIASRLTELKFGGVTMASAPVYNSSNQMTSLAVGSQITENYSFDPKTGLLLSQQVNNGPDQLLNLQYNYTLNNDSNNNGAKTGQLTSVTDLKNTARNRAYEYDKLGRLGKVKGGVDAFSNPAWYQSYAYDRYGNHTGVTKTGAAPQIPLDGLASLGFNTASNRINTAGFEYDPAGNQTRAVINDSGTQQQYRYDCAGRLAQVLDANGNVVATHSYGASNQRLVSVEGGVTRYFAWDGGQIIAEYEASGANALVWKTSYVYLGGRLLATTSGVGGTETRFHHPDRLGTRLVTDAGGTVVSEQLSMPFGTMLPFTQTYGGENSYQHPTLGNPSKKRFTSYDRSEVTGLDYAVNRFYSSQQGRFAQVDPIGMGAVSLGNPQSLNLYSYVENDPVNRVDPTGRNSSLIGFYSSLTLRYNVTINGALNSDRGGAGAGSSSDQITIELDPPNPDGGSSGDGEQKPGSKGEIKVDTKYRRCDKGDPLLTINGNSIGKKGDGGASIKLDDPAATFFSAVASQVSEREINLKGNTTLSLNLTKDGGYAISSSPSISVGLPGPFNVKVSSVQFNDKGVVTKAKASLLGLSEPASNQVKKAIEKAFGPEGGLNGEIVKNLLNTARDNPTGLCFTATITVIKRQ